MSFSNTWHLFPTKLHIYRQAVLILSPDALILLQLKARRWEDPSGRHRRHAQAYSWFGPLWRRCRTALRVGLQARAFQASTGMSARNSYNPYGTGHALGSSLIVTLHDTAGAEAYITGVIWSDSDSKNHLKLEIGCHDEAGQLSNSKSASCPT